MVEVPEVTNSLNDIKDSLDFWKMLKELWEPKYLVESVLIKHVLSSQKFCSHRNTIYSFLLNNMDLATNVLGLLGFYLIMDWYLCSAFILNLSTQSTFYYKSHSSSLTHTFI